MSLQAGKLRVARLAKAERNLPECRQPLLSPFVVGMPSLYLFHQAYRLGLSSFIQKEIFDSDYGNIRSTWNAPNRYHFDATLTSVQPVQSSASKPPTIFSVTLTANSRAPLAGPDNQIFHKEGHTIIECRKESDTARLGVLLISSPRHYIQYTRETTLGLRLGQFFSSSSQFRFFQSKDESKDSEWLRADSAVPVICSPLASMSPFTRQIDYLSDMLSNTKSAVSRGLQDNTAYHQLRALWTGESLSTQAVSTSVKRAHETVADHILGLYELGHFSIDERTHRWIWHSEPKAENRRSGARFDLTVPQQKVVKAICNAEPGIKVLHAYVLYFGNASIALS